MIPVDKEKIKVKLALTIPTDVPIALVNKIINIPLFIALKIIKILSMQSKIVTYLIFYYMIFFHLSH